jgi:predicted alpha-1,6-mannanase (GH76 family)
MSMPTRPNKPRTAPLKSPKDRKRFEKAVTESRARNAHLRPEEIEDAIEQALAEVRAERFASARTKSPK